MSPIARADTALLRSLRRYGHSDRRVERAVTIFSSGGEHGAAWLVLGAAGAAFDRRRRARWLRGAATVTAAYLLNTTVKYAVRRSRPQLDGLPQLIETPTQLSFPSSHAASSFAAASVYAPLLQELTAGRTASRSLTTLATAMAASRIYLGVHYPSDILAGAALGTVIGLRGRQATGDGR